MKVGHTRVDSTRVPRAKTLEALGNEYGQNSLPQMGRLKAGGYQHVVALSTNRPGEWQESSRMPTSDDLKNTNFQSMV